MSIRLLLALALYITITLICAYADKKKLGWQPIAFFSCGLLAGMALMAAIIK